MDAIKLKKHISEIAASYEKMTETELIALRAKLLPECYDVESKLASPDIDKQSYQYKILAAKKKNFSRELGAINLALKTIYKPKVHNENLFKEVVKEVVGAELYREIIKETDNRQKGRYSIVNIPFMEINKRADDKISELNKMLREYHEMLLNARAAITEYIRENEPAINKADYLKSVSIINRAVPTEQELNTKRRIARF